MVRTSRKENRLAHSLGETREHVINLTVIVVGTILMMSISFAAVNYLLMQWFRWVFR